MPTMTEAKNAKRAMLDSLAEKAKRIRAEIDADKAADKRLADAAPEMLEALKYVRNLIGTSRQYFPKSIKNHDKFQLEQICAAVGAAIHKAEASAE